MAALTADWTLHVITDRHLSGGRDQLDIIRLAIQGGATVVQLRDKDGPTRDMVELGRALRRLTRELGVVFLVNDRVDVALALDADGAHVGQDDLPADLARALLGPQRLLGVSAATPDEARAAQAAHADYVGTGTVYPTGSKADAGAPVGLMRLADVARAVTIPVVAIGGIGPGRAGPCIAHGAAGVAVISAIVAQ
ncbi:MAG: thiamine phosphate synthase, partial [Anaerolineae bacterium]|nr:thiamine phosphate synthase [Anaerolineae bacterium]